MNSKNVALGLILMMMISCDAPRANRFPHPACEDNCEYLDVSFLPIENLDNSTIYVKYGYSNNGDNWLTNLPMVQLPGNSTFMNLPLRPTEYNHFYFYADQGGEEEIGKLVLFNNNPTYSPICKVRVIKDGNFPSHETRIRITNTRRTLALKHALLYTSNIWTFGNQYGFQKNFNQCGDTLFSTAPATDYQHLYFYGKTGSNAHENNAVSKVIYRNTNSAKINISNITIR